MSAALTVSGCMFVHFPFDIARMKVDQEINVTRFVWENSHRESVMQCLY